MQNRDGECPVTEGHVLERQHTFYFGESMLGTFHSGDYLTLELVVLGDIRVGDLIAYRLDIEQDRETRNIVHRVVSVIPGGLILRGDNNSKNDINVITEQEIIGRVVYLERNGKTRRVSNGMIGMLRGRVLYLINGSRRVVWRLILRTGFRPYRWFRRKGLIRYVWNPPLTRITLHTEHGPVIKYSVRGRTVVWWYPESGRYQCRRPYDLLVPRESLEQRK